MDDAKAALLGKDLLLVIVGAVTAGLFSSLVGILITNFSLAPEYEEEDRLRG